MPPNSTSSSTLVASSRLPATDLSAAKINLKTTSATYTSAAGNYVINSLGGSDTITTGAGNSSVNLALTAGDNTVTMGAGNNNIYAQDGNNTFTTGAGASMITAGNGNNTITTGAGPSDIVVLEGNNTITTGAGKSIISAGDGNNTITTGAGDSMVSALVGNNTITTGAGNSSVLTTGGNNTVTVGAGTNSVMTGNGNDTITGGAGNDTIDSGGGSDTVNAGAGNDTIIYTLAVNNNPAFHSVYDGGTGIDTLRLVLTRAEWMSSAVQSDIAKYLTFISAHTGANGEADASPFTFSAFGLTTKGIEKLAVTVDGVALDPANHPVMLINDVINTSNGMASYAVDVLANDSVPDLIKSFTFSNPAHGSVALNAAYSNTAIAPTAQFIYTPAAGFYDYLAVGESAKDSFTYTVTDATGDVSTATVNVIISGANAAPVLTLGNMGGKLMEQIDPTVNLIGNGKIGFTDVNLSDTHSVSSVIAASDALGTLTVKMTADTNHSTGTDGAVSWTYSVPNATIEYLAAGQTKVETFSFNVLDNHGGSVPTTVTETITGIDTAPVAHDDVGSATEAGGVNNGTPGSNAIGNVLSNDTDIDSPSSAFKVIAVHTGAIEGAGTAGTVGTALTGAHGTLTLSTDGSYTYVVNDNDPVVQALNVGDKLSDTFNYTMQSGALNDQALLSITINGADDAPVARPDNGTVISAAGAVSVTFSPIGSAHASGVAGEYIITNPVYDQEGALWSDAKVSLNTSFNIAANLFFGSNPNGADGFTFIIQNISKTTIGLAGGGLGYQGIPHSVAIEFDTYNNGAGAFNDIPSPHTAFDINGSMAGVAPPISLGNIEDGQYHPVQINWNASSHTLSLTYNGAVVSSQVLDVSALVGNTEAYIGFAGSTGGANNLQKISGLSYQSADNSVVLDVLANATDVDDSVASLKVISAISDHGAAVSFSGGAGAGIKYTPGHAFDYLSVGETATDTITYVIADSHGATAASTAQVTVSGVNQAPVITAADMMGAVTQNNALKVLSSIGSIAFSDVNLSDIHSTSVVAAADNKLGGILTMGPVSEHAGAVGWTYSVDNSLTQHLAANQSTTETFNVTLSDGHGGNATQAVVITATGINDPATISGVGSGMVIENVRLSSAGKLLVSDLDDGQAAFQVQQSVSLYGSFSIDAAGNWGYTLNNSAAKVQALAQGQQISDQFSVMSQDGSARETVNIAIAGTHAPSLSQTLNDQFYPTYNGAWDSSLSNAWVWVAPDGAVDADVLPHSLIRQFVATTAQAYTFNYAIDDIGCLLVDGVVVPALNNVGYGAHKSATVSLSAGVHTMTMDVLNLGGPAGFALTVADASGTTIWNTRDHLTPASLIMNYSELQAPALINTGLTLSGDASQQLTGATISISAGFASGQDVLSFAKQNGISGTYHADTGVLNLSGPASLAQYQNALSSVSYSNTSHSPSTAARSVSFVVDDGTSQFSASNVVTSTVMVIPGNDRIYSVGNNVVLSGDAGSDTFIFSNEPGNKTGQGNASITNFATIAGSATQNHIEIDNIANIKSFTQLLAATTTDPMTGNALIHVMANETITLVGVHLDQLTASEFAFT